MTIVTLPMPAVVKEEIKHHLRQARTLARQQHTVTGRQTRKLLQGRADRG